MKTAILGAGGIGLGMAALLSSKGHDVRIWGPTFNGIGPLLGGSPLVAKGVVEGEFRASASLDVASVVEEADLVVVTVPGDVQRAALDLLVPHVRPGQLVAISSHLSLSALYLSRRLSERGVDAPISAWATTAVTAHRTGPGEVHVGSLRGQIVASSLPSTTQERSTAVLDRVFGGVFAQAADLMAATLTNVNPSTHFAVALCNLTRMEYGEEWGSYRGISGAVGRLVEALDRERIALAARFGLSVHTLQEHWHGSFKLPLGSVADMAAEQHRRRNGAPPGPATLDHRYVTEDVPFGIVPIVKFGRLAGVDMSNHEAGLRIISTLYGRDFEVENNLFDELRVDAMSVEELLTLCRDGFPRRDILDRNIDVTPAPVDHHGH